MKYIAHDENRTRNTVLSQKYKTNYGEKKKNHHSWFECSPRSTLHIHRSLHIPENEKWNERRAELAESENKSLEWHHDRSVSNTQT